MHLCIASGFYDNHILGCCLSDTFIFEGFSIPLWEAQEGPKGPVTHQPIPEFQQSVHFMGSLAERWGHESGPLELFGSAGVLGKPWGCANWVHEYQLLVTLNKPFSRLWTEFLVEKYKRKACGISHLLPVRTK